MVDASKTAIGAVLNQGEGDPRQPLAFFSKALQPTEQRYSTFGRELLAAYLSVKHCRHYAEGGRLLVFTDHKPLISAMASHSSKYTEREIRQLDSVRSTLNFDTYEGPRTRLLTRFHELK